MGQTKKIKNGLNHGVRFGFMGLVSGLCAVCCLDCLHLHKKFGELNLEKLCRRLVDGLISNACCMANVPIDASGGIH